MEIVVGITGASGVVYAVELLKKLKDRGEKIHLIVSENGEKVLR
ncbi:aromatic acid decarboxylase, partial [Candidatus Bathyarchaeota archaeon ex4484_205]